jgi:hypothetical protein
MSGLKRETGENSKGKKQYRSLSYEPYHVRWTRPAYRYCIAVAGRQRYF